MAKEGYHCYAPDWLGFGFSEKPQPEYDFAYTGISLCCFLLRGDMDAPYALSSVLKLAIWRLHGFSIGWVLSLWIRNWRLIFSFWWGIWSALGLLINSCRGRLSRGAWQADCQVGHSVSLLPRHAGIMQNFSNSPFLSIAFALVFSLFEFSFAGHDCGIIRLDMGFEESHSRQEDCCSEYAAHAVCPSSWHFPAAEVMRAL